MRAYALLQWLFWSFFLNENIELIVIGYKLIDFLEHVVFRQDKNFLTRRQVFILHIHAPPQNQRESWYCSQRYLAIV